MNLTSLAIDLKSFKKVRGDRDVSSHFQYVDEEAGLTLDLNGDGATETVRGYIYEPEEKYKYLRCPGLKSSPYQKANKNKALLTLRGTA